MSLNSIALLPRSVVGKLHGSVGPKSSNNNPRVVVLAPADDPAVVVECEECDVLVAVRTAVLGDHGVAAVLGDEDLRIRRLVHRVDDHREPAERVTRVPLALS